MSTRMLRSRCGKQSLLEGTYFSALLKAKRGFCFLFTDFFLFPPLLNSTINSIALFVLSNKRMLANIY